VNSSDTNLHTVARLMLLHGGRISIVQAETGLPLSHVNRLYREIFGDRPKSRGSFSFSAKRFLRNHDKFRDALLFALFHRLALREDDSGFPILAAYRIYQGVRPKGKFDYTDAFAMARFLMDGQILVQYCDCGAATLRLANEDVARCLLCDARIPGDS
jgi:hypothetical protein